MCFLQQRWPVLFSNWDWTKLAPEWKSWNKVDFRLGFNVLLDIISDLSTYGKLSSDSVEAHVDGVLKVRRGRDLRPVLVAVFLPASCRWGQRSACLSATAVSALKAHHCSHLFQRQRWRWSCSWTFVPRARTAAGENCDWPTASP